MPKLRGGRGSGFLAEVEELLNQALGHPRGTLALQAVLHLHGGADIYIPTVTERYIELRNSAVVNEFNGRNYQELSHKYSTSTSQIRRIIKAAARKKPS